MGAQWATDSGVRLSLLSQYSLNGLLIIGDSMGAQWATDSDSMGAQ